jgi:hypothetical protein
MADWRTLIPLFPQSAAVCPRTTVCDPLERPLTLCCSGNQSGPSPERETSADSRAKNMIETERRNAPSVEPLFCLVVHATEKSPVCGASISVQGHGSSWAIPKKGQLPRLPSLHGERDFTNERNRGETGGRGRQCRRSALMKRAAIPVRSGS